MTTNVIVTTSIGERAKLEVEAQCVATELLGALADSSSEATDKVWRHLETFVKAKSAQG